MTTAIETILRTNLELDDTYQVKQLLKNGHLAEAAADVIDTRRRALRRTKFVIYALLALPIMMSVIAAVWIGEWMGADSSGQSSFGIFAFFAMYHVLDVIEAKDSIRRLETILALWIVEGSGSEADIELATAQLLNSPAGDMMLKQGVSTEP